MTETPSQSQPKEAPSLLGPLSLLLARGLPMETAWAIARGRLEPPPPSISSKSSRIRFEVDLRVRGLLSPRPLVWPDPESVAATAQRLEKMGARLIWRGETDYPEKLLIGDHPAPPFVFVLGPSWRWQALACSVVGSRHTPHPFVLATRKLARELSRREVVVVSGQASGADMAAHEGAIQAGRGGTLVVPATGLVPASSRVFSRARPGAASVLSIGLPDAPFTPGLAVRRNDVVAALGNGLVLVASDLTGGSTYAVRWALRHKRPIWCFEAGSATPPGNARMLAQGQAKPLSLRDPPESWTERIAQSLSIADIRGPDVRTEQPTLV